MSVEMHAIWAKRTTTTSLTVYELFIQISKFQIWWFDHDKTSHGFSKILQDPWQQKL